MQFRILLFLTIIISSMFMACNKDELQAENSIEGIWDIVEITSIYGEFSENGFSPSETISETGELGTFIFTHDSVDFHFTRNDTIYTGTESWNITAKKVREGFIRVTEFKLTIENQFLFEVTFEDATKNSEKDAKSVIFVEQPPIGLGVLIEISSEKR